MEVFNLVVAKVPLVDAIQAFDIGVALGLECWPVEGSGLFDGETVCFRVVDGLSEGGGIERDLLGNAAERSGISIRTLKFYLE